MGGSYCIIFGVTSLLLSHPTIGLANDNADPYRLLGWISYVAIESFGSVVIQCYWALVNASVNVDFAKKNYGYIVAGAQIGSILGPTIATQAETIGIPMLYMGGSLCMAFMVIAMYMYVERFGVEIEAKEDTSSKKDGGVMEGFHLFVKYDYVKGIFAVSSLFMIQVTVYDYMMKVMAKDKYEAMYPDDHGRAVQAFASFMGRFGQVISVSYCSCASQFAGYEYHFIRVFSSWYWLGDQKFGPNPHSHFISSDDVGVYGDGLDPA